MADTEASGTSDDVGDDVGERVFPRVSSVHPSRGELTDSKDIQEMSENPNNPAKLIDGP